MVMNKTDEEWKKQLDPQQYRVLRKKATEPAFTGKYLHNKDKGVYVCAACGAELFSSDTKYDSGSGWPSFWTALAKDNIVEVPTGHSEWNGSRFYARTAVATWATSLTMGPSRRECATA